MNPELPPNWTAIQLGELGTWVGGGTPSKARSDFWAHGNIPWVSPKDMKVETIHDAADHITTEAIAGSSSSLVAAGSVLVVVRSGILRHSLPTAVTAVEVALNQDMKGLTPLQGVNARYIAWALRRFEQEILHTCTKGGTTVQSVDMPRFSSFVIPLAPLAEQGRIVAAIEEHMSRLDSGVAGLRRIQAQLPRYRAAMLNAAVGGRLVGQKSLREDSTFNTSRVPPWPTLTLENISSRITKGTTPTTAGYGYAERGVRFVKAESLQDGRIVPEYCAFITPETHDAQERSQLRAGDILFTIAGTLGRAALVVESDLPANTNQAVAIIRLLDSRVSRFVLLSLQAPAVQGQVRGSRRGVGLFNLNLSQVSNLSISIPPLPEQEAIVSEVDLRLSHIQELASGMELGLQRASRLRISILARAFSGQLVPQDPNDEPASVLVQRIRAERVHVVPRAGKRRTASDVAVKS